MATTAAPVAERPEPSDAELRRVLLLTPADLPASFELRQGERVVDVPAFLEALRRDLTEPGFLPERGRRNALALFHLLSSTPG